MEQYRDAYPQVELIAGPGLDRRRKDLAFDAVLDSAPIRAGATTSIRSFIPEVVFFTARAGR